MPRGLTLADIDYPLPEDLIAVRPSDQREGSRLMRLDRGSRTLSHLHFKDIIDLLVPGDLLVFNNSKVLQARLLGNRKGRETEMLLVERIDARNWKAMVKQSRKFKEGDLFEMEQIALQVMERVEDGMRRVCFDRDMSFEDINAVGHTPVPPYIVKKRMELGMAAQEDQDEERYQSVMARFHGSVAAPTASLHFSRELLSELKAKGVKHTEVTLHIGPGTFKPVEGDIESYRIHREWVEVGEQAVSDIQGTRKSGGRIVAVGTTVVRSLETAAAQGELSPYSGYSRLYITPPYDYKVIDALITNFHMPRSTLLLLVYAFGGVDFIREAYHTAIRERYRFFSYGDAMFIE